MSLKLGDSVRISSRNNIWLADLPTSRWSDCRTEVLDGSYVGSVEYINENNSLITVDYDGIKLSLYELGFEKI